MRTSSSRRYRARYDIVAEILNVSIKGAKRTRIMYRANLSFAQLDRYIDLLIRKELLEEIKNSERLYMTTGRGKTFLKSYEIVKFMLGT